MVPQTSTIWPFWPKIGIFGRIPHFWVYAENFVKKWPFWPFFGLKMLFCPQKPFLVMQKCISYILDDYCSVKSEESQKKIFFLLKNAKLEKSYCPWW